jgi:hypothetical protein
MLRQPCTKTKKYGEIKATCPSCMRALRGNMGKKSMPVTFAVSVQKNGSGNETGAVPCELKCSWSESAASCDAAKILYPALLFLRSVTTKRDFLVPIESAASFLVRSPLAQLNTTFCVLGLSPLVMTMLVALNFFFNAELTYFLQPAHVTPVIVAT